MNKEKIEQAIKLIQEAIRENEHIELEDHNFKVDSNGWKKITTDDTPVLENSTKDIWEFLDGEFKGEQLFTWDAAMRETKKAGKRMPTDEEFTSIETENDIPNLVLAGYRYADGTFSNRTTYAYFWSSSQYGASYSWFRKLGSSYATVYRYYNSKAFGFSVRCLKE